MLLPRAAIDATLATGTFYSHCPSRALDRRLATTTATMSLPSKYPDETGGPPVIDDTDGDVDTSDFRSIDPVSGVKRGLRTRHLSMMALAGIIGPGLLVGAGGALSTGGPASLLIGFGLIGIVAFRYV